MQNHYNLLYREEEREMFPTLKLGTLVWIPWCGELSRFEDVRRRRDSVVAARPRIPHSPVRQRSCQFGGQDQAPGGGPLDCESLHVWHQRHREPVRTLSLWAIRVLTPLALALLSVEQVAKAHGVPMAQVALAWLLSKDGEEALALILRDISFCLRDA
jgi:hypothetical protein